MYSFFCNLILSIGFLTLPITSYAQEEEWDVYMAQYEDGPGSITLNMSMRKIAPVKELPFVLITGVKFKNWREGMPSIEEFPKLYEVSDSIHSIVSVITKNSPVGTFTYQCERLDYIYLADTAKVRKALSDLYAANFKSYEFYINIKPDQEWNAYLTFLYPNNETLEFMQNQKVVMHLIEKGDKLEKEREVVHWIYFDSEGDSDCFISYVTNHGFKIVSKERTTNPQRLFKLQISRSDLVDVQSISKVTIELKKEALKCKGDYDGWETMLIN